MTIGILTLFPDMVRTVLDTSMLKRAQTDGAVTFTVHDLRSWGIGPHKNVDDTPYGGGAGMLLRVDVVDKALAELTQNQDLKPRIILMTPQGKPFSQKIAQELAADGRDVLLIAGHYEGFDERIRGLVDDEISIGDFVVTGGELPALIIADAVARLLPNALGSDKSVVEESFSLTADNKPLLEYPHYTRPDRYAPVSQLVGEQPVPDILKSGNHAAIAAWRHQQSLERTKTRRPDLLDSSR